MTYHYKYWSAFTEADLLSAGDYNISIGDTFTMPASATVTLAAWDDDGQLSGDIGSNEQATDADQCGWVHDGTCWQQTGDLYVEKTFTLQGSDGKTYILAEIEGEGHNAAGAGDDYFSFVGATPPAGVTLTVVSSCNSHGVDYSDLSADASAPVNTGPVFDNLPADGMLHIDENTSVVLDINASDADGDTLTYSIVGGADAGKFEINAHTGQLSFVQSPDYENPTDGNHDNKYDVKVQVSDGNGGTATKTLWVTVKDVNEHVNTAPVFDNLPADGVICIDENSTFVINVDASDIDGDALTYTITGGRDASFFEIDAHTGELVFKDAQDFENPQSGGNNNTYDVTVIVSDGNGGTVTKPLWIKVKDVDETGPVCITIEAEHMNKYNFFSVGGTQASNDCLVKLDGGQSGDLSTTFHGETGSYDIKVFAQDESDGQSTIMVKVNGNVVGTITLDRDSDGSGSNNGGFSEFVLEDIQISQGDVVQLWAQAQGGEYVRIDKIELCQDGEVCDAKLDFEGLNSGAVVNDQFAGVTITAQRATNNTAANDAMIFDSNAPTGGDHDLEYTGRGNILIISEDNDSSDADDAIGGTITFDFDNPSDLKDIVLLDIEEAGGTIVLTKADGSTQTIAIPAAGDNSAQTITLNATDVVSMDINLVGSGAVDDLCWTPGEAPVLGSLGGTYFMDNNDNSVEDAGDMAIANATVWLLQNGAVIASTTTDANGDYLFDDLAAGDYAVRFDEQNGKSFVDGNVGGDDTIDSDVTVVGGAGNGNTDTVTVGAGEDVRNVDAGVEVVDSGDAQISGRITFDADDDDTENAAGGGFDVGFGDKTVELLNEAGDVIATTTTGADGSYSFTGLDAGTYSVNFPDTMGLTIADKDVGAAAEDSDANANGQTDPITLVIGQNVPNVDLSLQDPANASLGGRIFHDSDNDDQDNGNGNEAPAAGVTVRLLDANGVELDTAVTDPNGEYLFENLKAGDYKVDFPLEVDGKVLVGQNVGDDLSDSDASQATGETDVVSVGISENVRDVDAGVEDPGTAAINGRLFMDNNGDNLEDAGDMGLGDIEVSLLNAAGDVIATTTTNANGEYTFGGLGAGDYSVSFPTEVDGKVLVEQNVGADETVDSDADQDTGRTDTISLEIGDVSDNNDAGVADPGTASLAGKVFMDNNDNSQNDAGDMAISGVAVQLLDINGDVVGNTTTNADGTYEFTGLDAGSYSVRFPTTVDGKTLVDSNQGPDATDSDANVLDGETPVVELGIGARSENNDAGFEDPNGSAITGRVFMDNNDNSQDDAGDMGVEGVEVTLLDENGAVITTTTTGPNGGYSFTGLAAGVYSVTFPTEVGGKVLVEANVGPDATDSDANEGTGNTGPITVGINETSNNNDAGIEDPGTAAIGDRVFLDANGNGQQDLGEQGVAGVDVTVFNADGTVAGTDTTDANGDYLVGGLDAGTYTVGFEDVDGFDFTTANQGLDGSDSDADQTTGLTGGVTLDIGETDLTVDAGLVAENTDPVADDDEGMVCATEATIIDVLDGDTDADGDTPSVAHVNGQDIAVDGSVTLASGAVVTLLADGTLSYDSSTAVLNGVPAAEIVQGETATDTFTYSITDGNGGTDTGEVTVTVKGDLDTIDTILAAAPTSGTATFSGFSAGEAYTAILSGTGDVRYDGLTIAAAYCLEYDADFDAGIDVTVDISGALDALTNPGDFVNDTSGNLDLINWLINQDFTSQDNGDGTGTNYTDAEIQGAIWGITDDTAVIFESPTNGTIANALELQALAEANGEGFVAGEGDLFTLILNPTEVQAGVSEADDFDQAFIIALPFDDYKEDCIC
jgi:serine-aspartate repeat-containing protein C/D/E